MSTDVTRLVYRRGLELVRGESGGWRLRSSEELDGDPTALVATCGREPLLIEQRFQDGNSRTSLMLPGLRHYGLAQTWLKQRMFDNDHGGCLIEWQDVDYLLGAVGYHCAQLAEAYAGVRNHFARLPQPPGRSSRDRGGTTFTGASDHVWYELDALLSAARRTLDLSRFVLWNRYGKATCPRNFLKTVQAASMPDALRVRLLKTWTDHGKHLTEMRDCIQHNTALTSGMGAVFVDNRDHGIWLVSAHLPDNPEAKSRERFTYRRRVDALDYAYTIVIEWMDVMKTIAKNIKPHPDFDRDE